MFESDLDDFFSDFAVEVVVLDTHRIVKGIFDKPFSDALDITGFTPSLTMKTSEADEFLQRGYRLDIQSAIYIVQVLEQDGTGVTRVVLEAE